MKIKDLTPNAANPRTITDAKLKMLKKAMTKFGDLSGIVFNKKSNKLVGGHQRTKIIDSSAVVTVVKTYSRPTKTGTVAEGFVEMNGERFSYREVYWDAAHEKAANIAANKGAGEFDPAKLHDWLKDLTSFDTDFDINLTMFDAKELASLPSPIEVAAHTRTPGSGKDEEEQEDTPAKCKAGEVYALGATRLKCGEDDLKYCDLIISRWEKYSGQEAILLPKSIVRKKAAKQRESSVSHG